MSNTLRRKMFKLGGSANTHGIGITSGLKMNKGGRVGFQPGGLANRGIQPGSRFDVPIQGRTMSGGQILDALLTGRSPETGQTTGSPRFAAAGILSQLGQLDDFSGNPLDPFGALRNIPKGRFGPFDLFGLEPDSSEPFQQFLEANPSLASEFYRQKFQNSTNESEAAFARKEFERFEKQKETPYTLEQIEENPLIGSRVGDFAGTDLDIEDLVRRKQFEDQTGGLTVNLPESDQFVVSEDAPLGGITSLLDRSVKGALPDRLQEAVEAAIPERVLNLSEPPDLSIPEREVKTEGDEQEPIVQTGMSDEEVLEQVEKLKKEEQEKEFTDNYERYLDLLQRDREGERGRSLASAITQGSLKLMEGQGAESVQDALEAFAGEIEKGATRTQDIQDKAKLLAVQDIQKEPERELAERTQDFAEEMGREDVKIRKGLMQIQKDSLDIQKFSAESQAAYNEGKLKIDTFIAEANNNYREAQVDLQLKQLGIDERYKEGMLDYYEKTADREDLATLLDSAGGDPTQIIPFNNALELREKGITTIAPLNQRKTAFNADAMQENIIYGDIDAITGNLYIVKKDDKVLNFPTYQAALEFMTQ